MKVVLMHTIIKYFFALVLMMSTLFASIEAWGQGTGGLSYVQVDDDDITVGALVTNFGYRYQLSDTFALTPEVRFGAGVKDDGFAGINFKLKSVIAGALRAELTVSDYFYAFGVASYGDYKFKLSIPGVASETASSSDAGYGGGIGFRLPNSPDNLSIEIGYEDIDSIGVFSTGLRYRF